MNHRDLDRHITGNWGEDQYPEKLVRECPKCTGVGDTSKQYACVTCLANYMDEPKCARCESRYYVLDSESVCPVCREAEVNRDDGC